MTKALRQQAILEIIQEQVVETQEELLEALEAKGISSTQATISRDIKELSLSKQFGAGCSRYVVVPSAPPVLSPATSLLEAFASRAASQTSAPHSLKTGEEQSPPVPTEGNNPSHLAPLAPLSPLLSESILSVVAVEFIVILKTKPGLAMAVCTALDNMELEGNVGTIAGDDTCMMVMESKALAKKCVKCLTP